MSSGLLQRWVLGRVRAQVVVCGAAAVRGVQHRRREVGHKKISVRHR